MNPFRNEMNVELAGETILLRPTFENLAAMETDIGGIPFLAWKFGKSVSVVDGKMVLGQDSLPPMSICTKVIFHNQEPKKFSLEQVHEMVMAQGITATRIALNFIMKCTAGNRQQPDLSDAQKKS